MSGKKLKSRETSPVTYDVTIIIRGNAGSMETKHLKIPRDKIMAPGYPEFIRRSVEIYERFVVTGKVTGQVKV
jgi:hypothetical protein